MINSRESLTQYALTKLGAPVIEINCADSQISDRLDEALQIMLEQHISGSEKVILTYQITASSLSISSNNGMTFIGQPSIIGATSGATANLTPFGTTNTTLSIQDIQGTFIAGETISTQNGLITGTISATTPFLLLGDIDNGYIQLPDTVISAIRLLPISSAGNGANNPFDITYQFRLNDMYSLTNTSMIYYTQMQQQLALMEMTLVGEKPIRFNQHMHRLYITMDWQNFVYAGQYIAVECYRIVDPNSFTNVYNNQWLKKYFTSLLKQQWASNMSKYSDQVLPGGVKLNAGQLAAEAAAEIEASMAELAEKWAEKPTFFLG